MDVFLDLKLHDIPATVGGAARSVAKLHPDLLTVHAAAGPAAIARPSKPCRDTKIIGVTVLTSLCDADLDQIGLAGPVSDAACRLAALAVRGWCSRPGLLAEEVSAVRAEVGPDITLITPGIRPAGQDSNDQARVATPQAALRAGADLLVIGRPITGAADPGAAAAALGADLRRLANLN